MVGRRLIDMLIERGAERIISIDIATPPQSMRDNKQTRWVQADITDYDQLIASKAFEGGVDVVFRLYYLNKPYSSITIV